MNGRYGSAVSGCADKDVRDRTTTQVAPPENSVSVT